MSKNRRHARWYGARFLATAAIAIVVSMGASGVALAGTPNPVDPSSYVQTQINAGATSAPYGIAVSPDGSTVYVADAGNGRVVTMSPTGADVKTFASVPGVGYVAVSPDGSLVYALTDT